MIIIIGIVAIFLLWALFSKAKTNADIESDYQHMKEMEKNDITSPPYKVGDYYNDGVHQGFVFSISNGGYHGKIVSMIQHQQDWCKWFDAKQSWGCKKKPAIICSSRTDGMGNMRKLIDNMIEYNYPVYSWIKCIPALRDFYLPAIDELKEIRKYKDLLNSNGRSQRMTYHIAEEIGNGKYLSSTETIDNILVLDMKPTYTDGEWEEDKDYDCATVRCVFKF